MCVKHWLARLTRPGPARIEISEFKSMLHKHKIGGSGSVVERARAHGLKLVEAAQTALARVLGLMGMKAPESM